MPPQQKKKIGVTEGVSSASVASNCDRVPVAVADDMDQAADKVPGAAKEISAALYEQLGQMADRAGFEHSTVDVSGTDGHEISLAAKPISQEDYVTVVVTPKLTFQLLKRPEWQTVQDITQAELRRGFLSRFPPALWLSSEKFSFRPASPPTSTLTQDTKTLFFKIVSDEVPDERVMLGILRELEKSYEAIIKRAVTETRSEALQEQFNLQEQTEELRREQAKQVKELRKQVSSLKEQNQSIQKRLFLVEQEKDQLQREQHQMKELVQRLERQQVEQVQQAKTEQQDLRTQFEALAARVAGIAESSAISTSEKRPMRCAENVKTSKATAEVEVQTDRTAAKEDRVSTVSSQITDMSRRLDQLQQQMGALQGWMLQGSQVLSAVGPTMVKQ